MFLENDCLHVSNIVLFVRFSTTQSQASTDPNTECALAPRTNRIGVDGETPVKTNSTVEHCLTLRSQCETQDPELVQG